MAVKTKQGGEAARCVVTSQPTSAGYRATFSLDGVTSAAEGGYRHYALNTPEVVDGRAVDEFYEDALGVRYETLDDVPAEKRGDLEYLTRLVFRSVVVAETKRPPVAAASLDDVAADIAADGRAGWLIWNPSGPILPPVGDEPLVLGAPVRIRIDAGQSAAAVREAILGGGKTPVQHEIQIPSPNTGRMVTVTVTADQQVVPPLAGAYEELRRRAGR